MTFDRFAIVDWSGGNGKSATPQADAIWAGEAGCDPVYLQNRQVAETWLADRIDRALKAGERLMLGFDFPFGYPAGFARALTGTDDPLAVWAWLEARITDSPKANNRFEVADQINAQLGGAGPFWGHPTGDSYAHLAPNKQSYTNPFADRRKAEQQAKGAQPVWKLYTTGSVGSQALTGLPVLERLRRAFPDQIAVWPFQPLDRPIALVEVWPSLLAPMVQRTLEVEGGIKDAVQVATLAQALASVPSDMLAQMLDVDAPEEGWILGLGHEDALMQAARPEAPRPDNDCFALPPGVDWLPVTEALAHLQSAMRPVTEATEVPLPRAAGRILAEDISALRAHPPTANSAVDGYGFAGGAEPGSQVLPLVAGRAAAGQPYDGQVPAGHAIRILTGAALPEGVDTVVLDEDVQRAGGEIAFHGPIKPGANTRPAGEDTTEGTAIFAAGHRLTAPDLARLASTGRGRVPVHRALRVALASTGDELAEPSPSAPPHVTFDANRPMLAALIEGWGMELLDLGRLPDDRVALGAAFDAAAAEADVLITSGGASAGDEDHIAALLTAQGHLHHWRIALKPGRPLALGQWGEMPVFGLPGNPVAALTCALIFARPALFQMAGRPWEDPVPLMLPALFTKTKKPGRAEYLRARRTPDGIEVFASEGSGRISGLSWADGFVALPHEAATITPGTLVPYLPFDALMR